MSLTVNTNLEAMNASRNLNRTENMLAMAMQRLSSGLRINSAADDVAGYAISQRLQAQVNGLNQATQNSQDASRSRRPLRARSTTSSRCCSASASSRCSTPTARPPKPTRKRSKQRANSSKKRSSASVKRRSSTASNSSKGGAAIKFQVGANENETIEVKATELEKAVEKVSLKELKTIDEAIGEVATAAGEFGAVQNRIQYTSRNLEVYSQNLSSAVSGIVDVNMAY